MSGLPPHRPTAGRIRWHCQSCSIPVLRVHAVWSELYGSNEAHRCQTPRESYSSSPPRYSLRILIQLINSEQSLRQRVDFNLRIQHWNVWVLYFVQCLALIRKQFPEHFFQRTEKWFVPDCSVLSRVYKWSFRNPFRGIRKSKLLDVIPWPGVYTLILIRPCDSWLGTVERLSLYLLHCK